nr:hypothetical protein [Halogeometricum borinquense]
MATRKPVAAFTDVGLVSVVEVLDELVCFCLFDGFDNFVCGCVWGSVADVLGDGSSEEVRVLTDIADSRPVTVFRKLADIGVVDGDRSAGGVVEAEKELEDC